jgi:hypothetical protein
MVEGIFLQCRRESRRIALRRWLYHNDAGSPKLKLSVTHVSVTYQYHENHLQSHCDAAEKCSQLRCCNDSLKLIKWEKKV